MTIREVHIHRADTTRDPVEPVMFARKAAQFRVRFSQEATQ